MSNSDCRWVGGEVTARSVVTMLSFCENVSMFIFYLP